MRIQQFGDLYEATQKVEFAGEETLIHAYGKTRLEAIEKCAEIVKTHNELTTRREVERLRDEERARTGIEWEVCDA